jgi:hypothetical protein
MISPVSPAFRGVVGYVCLVSPTVNPCAMIVLMCISCLPLLVQVCCLEIPLKYGSEYCLPPLSQRTSFFYLFTFPIIDSMSCPLVFPAFNFSPLISPFWNQFPLALKSYLRALYLFTCSDYRTTLIPVVSSPTLSSSAIHVFSHM